MSDCREVDRDCILEGPVPESGFMDCIMCYKQHYVVRVSEAGGTSPERADKLKRGFEGRGRRVRALKAERDRAVATAKQLLDTNDAM